jgi:hypothetical protein
VLEDAAVVAGAPPALVVEGLALAPATPLPPAPPHAA